MAFSFRHSGGFKKTEKFLANAQNLSYLKILDHYANKGLEALSSATPVDEGDTAASWGYEVHAGQDHAQIVWTNSHLTSQGDPIAIMLQYGHGTGTGGYVEGVDYINPAIKPIFDDIAEKVWEEVRK